MWDLKLSDNGDLVFALSRDFQGVVGADLTNQRIALRLRLPRGSFLFNKTHDMGSNLYDVLRRVQTAPQAAVQVEPLVREALLPMDDIQVENVDVSYIDDHPDALHGIAIHVTYVHVISSGEAASPLALGSEAREVVVNVGTTGQGAGFQAP